MSFNISFYQPKFSFITSSFGNEKHHICASRLIETIRSYVTSNIHCLTDNNLYIEICKIYLDILKKYNVEIRSSFIWKPWLILSQLKKLSKNGILLYLDAGSEISKKKKCCIRVRKIMSVSIKRRIDFF